MHIGHLRLALEISEAMGSIRTELVPCAVPPHKNSCTVLPFELRHAMLVASTNGLPNIFVNDLEGKRSGPSYTYDTLLSYNDKYYNDKYNETHTDIFFCLGLGDFMVLDTWRNGLELPELAQLVIIPRGNEKLEDFSNTVRSFWPESRELAAEPPFTKSYILPRKNRIHALSLPRLDLSSSFIRSRWREGRNLAFLIPGPALALLLRYNDIVKLHWGDE